MTRLTPHPIPLHHRSRANRARWLAERLWLRKLPLRDRLTLAREMAKREFVPTRPYWHRLSR